MMLQLALFSVRVSAIVVACCLAFETVSAEEQSGSLWEDEDASSKNVHKRNEDIVRDILLVIVLASVFLFVLAIRVRSLLEEGLQRNQERDSSRRRRTKRQAAEVELARLVVILCLLVSPPLSILVSAQEEQELSQRPNILFLIDESTDGRTYRPDFAPIDLVNIKRLFSKASTTVQFDTHYVTAPVCAASRASIWSGKYPHKIPHYQAHNKNHLKVNGVWNNFEGLPSDYRDKIHDVLERSANYTIKISGKTDWVTGGHSLDNRLSAWTMYTSFPYNISAKHHAAGFYTEYGMCTGNGTITDSNVPKRGGYYSGDWKALNETTDWIVQRGKEQATARSKGEETFQPFFAYQGMNIVHPAYHTSQYWYNKVNLSAVTAPEWKTLDQLHPCDFQATMLKGCLPQNSSQAHDVYAKERRKRIRAIYYAMILEYDSMVGAYLDALESVDGLAENTVVILTSDHGDMQMEHQQFYKHVAYDASSRVPLIIKIPNNNYYSSTSRRTPTEEGDIIRESTTIPFVTQPTSHVDLFPTIMDLARVSPNLRPKDLHGESLLPFLVPSKEANDPHRPFAINQFHGCDIAMSWFSIIDENQYKYNVFGTGQQHDPQLFDLRADPEETNNLATNPSFRDVVHRLDDQLRTVVDYPAVATNVAHYTHASLGAWVNATGKDWPSIVQNLRWKECFDLDINASIKAIQAYLKAPPKVYECRSESVWPPPPIDDNAAEATSIAIE